MKVNINIAKQFKAIAEENKFNQRSIRNYNGLQLSRKQIRIIRDNVPPLSDEERILSLLASCEVIEGDALNWKDHLDQNEKGKVYPLETVSKVYEKVMEKCKCQDHSDNEYACEALNVFSKYIVSAGNNWTTDLLLNNLNEETLELPDDFFVTKKIEAEVKVKVWVRLNSMKGEYIGEYKSFHDAWSEISEIFFQDMDSEKFRECYIVEEVN